MPKICRKIYQAQEKFQKIISSHVEANLETTFDYCSPEIARKCAEDMSDDIPDTEKNSQKLLRVILVHSLRLFSILTRQKSTETNRKICLMIYQKQEKFQKIIPSRLKHIERLFSIISLPKSIDNVRMTCPMIYQSQ